MPTHIFAVISFCNSFIGLIFYYIRNTNQSHHIISTQSSNLGYYKKHHSSNNCIVKKRRRLDIITQKLKARLCALNEFYQTDDTKGKEIYDEKDQPRHLDLGKKDIHKPPSVQNQTIENEFDTDDISQPALNSFAQIYCSGNVNKEIAKGHADEIQNLFDKRYNNIATERTAQNSLNAQQHNKLKKTSIPHKNKIEVYVKDKNIDHKKYESVYLAVQFSNFLPINFISEPNIKTTVLTDNLKECLFHSTKKSDEDLCKEKITNKKHIDTDEKPDTYIFSTEERMFEPSFKAFLMREKSKLLQHNLTIDANNKNLYYQALETDDKNTTTSIIPLDIIKTLNKTKYTHHMDEIWLFYLPDVQKQCDCKQADTPLSYKLERDCSLNIIVKNEIFADMKNALHIIKNEISKSNNCGYIFTKYKETLGSLFHLQGGTRLKPILWKLTLLMPELIFYLEKQLLSKMGTVCDIESLRNSVTAELNQLLMIIDRYCEMYFRGFDNTDKKPLVFEIKLFRNLVLDRMRITEPNSLQYTLYAFASHHYRYYGPIRYIGNNSKIGIIHNFLLFILAFILESDTINRRHLFKEDIYGMKRYIKQSKFIEICTTTKQYDFDFILSLVYVIDYLEKLKGIDINEQFKILYIRPYKFFYIVIYKKANEESNTTCMVKFSILLQVLYDRIETIINYAMNE